MIANPGDAFAPDTVSQEVLSRRVATCNMGDGIRPAGNGALGSRALKAFEENTARRTGGTFMAMGPVWNRHCRENIFDYAEEFESLLKKYEIEESEEGLLNFRGIESAQKG